MRSVAICSQKGGVGKTTTVVNVAAALADAGRLTLVIDVDGQGAATRWLGAEPTRDVLDVFTGEVELIELVTPSNVPGGSSETTPV